MFLSVLNNSYPISTSGKRSLKVIVFFGVFIGLFLLIFQPFGISEISRDNEKLIIVGYGFVTSFILAINTLLQYALKSVFNEKRWKVYKHILWVLWIITTIAAGNLIYTHIFFSWPKLSWNNFFMFQLITLLVALLPLTVVVLITQNTLLKLYVKKAAELNLSVDRNQTLQRIAANPKNNLITLPSENKNDNLTIEANCILYIESTGNYVKVYYDEKSNLQTKLLRNTIKSTTKILAGNTTFFQCHRAYIVNLKRIKKIEGNALGYHLILNGTQNKIPVSRNYIPKFNRIFKPR